MGFFSGIKKIVGSVASLGSAFLKSKGQKDANEQSISEAELNRQFQVDFYKKRHQREVEDLKKAGLNPILSAKFGGGTVSPVQPNIQNIAQDLDQVPEAAMNVATSALGLKLQRANIKNVEANTALAYSKAATERTVQAQNIGRFSIPGFYSGPFSTAKQFFKRQNFSDYSNYARGLSRDLKNILRGRNPYN